MDRKRHWEDVYVAKRVQETSWHQDVPGPSLDMIATAAGGRKPALIDVGGGASLLVDFLLDQGFEELTVLDISGRALEQARLRLGPRAARVDWIEADVVAYAPTRRFGIWHDRAAFHFLTAAQDRKRYVRVLEAALVPGGQVIVAAFALDGPERCSGLEVVRYDARGLAAELGPEFHLEETSSIRHVTPAGREQRFGFHRFRKAG